MNKATQRHAFAAVAGLLALLSGCSTVGSISDRAIAINALTADYQASAILLNILRASEAEPLNFVSLVSATGHDTLTAGVGLPTLFVGPNRTATQTLVSLGPNTVGASVADDFNVSVLDDPVSQAALSRPIDPDTVAFLIGQDYTASLVMFLFIDQLDLRDDTGKLLCLDRHLYHEAKTADGQVTATHPRLADVNVIPCPSVPDPDNRPYASFANEPLTQDDQGNFTYDPSWQYEFAQLLFGYLYAGLYATADPDFVPGGGSSAHGRFCFDPTSVDPVYHQAADAKPDICPPSLTAPKAAAPVRDFSDPMRQVFGKPVHVYVTLRSVYAAYRFAGEIVRAARESGSPFAQPPAWLADNERLRKTNLFFGQPASRMAEIAPLTPGEDCWGIARHGGKTYCVPAGALRTKRTFALLHLLFVLNTKPNNTPTTTTVRALSQ